jgi:hypothetical protein
VNEPECLQCFRILEIQKADAVRFYGPHAVWKDFGQRLLDQTCTNRTGRHEEDGCWPDWTSLNAGLWPSFRIIPRQSFLELRELRQFSLQCCQD